MSAAPDWDRVYPFSGEHDYLACYRILRAHVYPEISANAWGVLGFILEKTMGFKKWQDDISYSQIAKDGKISRNTAIKSIRELMGQESVRVDGEIVWLPVEDAPVLIFCINGEMKHDGKREINRYSLNREFSIWVDR